MYAQNKRSAYPQPTKQQGKRSRNQAVKSHNSKTILYRLRKFCKHYNWARIGIALLILGLAIFAVLSVPYLLTRGSDTEADAGTKTVWVEKTGFEKRYNLTDSERLEIAQVITAEADSEPFAGKVAVAQCILQACEDTGMRPREVLSMYSYSNRRPDPSGEAMEAVAAVFDFGYVATTEPIKYFYAPALIDSEWHESQEYVMTINNHKFFKEAGHGSGSDRNGTGGY